MNKILILGACSAIAQACARGWAATGAELFLVARDPKKLDVVAADLTVRGASNVHVYTLDFTDQSGHQAMLSDCFEQLGQVDMVLLAHGELPDQQACEQDPAATEQALAVNGLSTITLLTALARRMEPRGQGTLVVLGSVAGDRGRPSNYVYGAAKGALDVFCEGLRARLFKSGLHLMTVKPGFVETPMTAALDLPGLLTASPDTIARCIDRGIVKRRDIIYTPWFWRPIMLLIRLIPQWLFKRISL